MSETVQDSINLKCGPIPNVMAALLNIGGALCSTLQSWLTPNTGVPCRNAAKTRNPLKYAGVPKLTKRSQPLARRSAPHCKHLWRRYCCLIICPIVDTCLSCQDIARQIGGMVPRWRIFLSVLCPVFSASSVQQVSDMLNLHKGHTMCGSMVDIQSPTAEIRRGKKKEEER